MVAPAPKPPAQPSGFHRPGLLVSIARTPLRVGVHGAGEVATASYGVLSTLRPLLDKITFAAVSDADPDLARWAAGRFGAAGWYRSLDEMLERAEIDAVVNLVPVHERGGTSLQVVDAGKHLALEKVLAPTLEEADALIAVAEQRGVVITCSPCNMLYPARQEARRLVREGVIGRVAFAKVRASGPGPAAIHDWPTDPTWYYGPGMGPVLDLGVSGLADMVGIIGPVRRVTAFSGITRATRTVRSGPFEGHVVDVKADDNTVALFDFGDNTFGVFDSSFNVSGTRAPSFEVFGSDGALSIPNNTTEEARGLEMFHQHTGAGLGGWTALDVNRFSAAQRRLDTIGRNAVLDHLVDVVEGRTPNLLTARIARHLLEIAAAISQSAQSGTAVELQTDTFEL